MPKHEELIELFTDFYRNHYRDDIGRLAQAYPEERSLYIDYNDLQQYNPDLAEDFLNEPERTQEYAEEALRLYDIPADIKLNQAHVRPYNVPETVEIRDVTSHQDLIGTLVSVEGIVKNTSEVQSQATEAAFTCRRCGTMNYVPQIDDELQKPHECQGCERKGPFVINEEQSEFVDRQEFLLQENPEWLKPGVLPNKIRVELEDDICGEATPGDHIDVNGVLHIEKAEGEEDNVFYCFLEAFSIQDIEEEETEQPSNTESFGVPDLETYADLAATAVSTIPDEAREEETKAKLITPFVEALGWNKYDSTEVRMEHTDSRTRTRPDYALFGPDSEQPDVIVEAKQLNTRLVEKENQLYDYLRVFSAEWGVLTNGKEFRIYQYRGEGDLPQHLATMGIEDLPEADILDSLRRNQFYG